MRSFAIQVTLQDISSVHQENSCHDGMNNTSPKLESLIDRHSTSRIMKTPCSTTKQITNDVLAISDNNIKWQKSEDQQSVISDAKAMSQQPEQSSINHPTSNSGNLIIIRNILRVISMKVCDRC